MVSSANVSLLMRRLRRMLIVNPAADGAILAWRLRAARRPSDRSRSTPKQVTNCEFDVAYGAKRALATSRLSPRRARQSSLSTPLLTGRLAAALGSGPRATMPLKHADARRAGSMPCWTCRWHRWPGAEAKAGMRARGPNDSARSLAGGLGGCGICPTAIPADCMPLSTRPQSEESC
jgi:hypothetical protein